MTWLNLRSSLLLGIIVLLGVGLLWPGAKLGLTLVTGESDPVLSGYYLHALLNTLFMGAGVAVSATCLGFIVAYSICATRTAGRGILKALYLAPLFAPSIMPAIGLIYLIGSNGVLMQCELYGALGVFLGGLIFALPHAVLQVEVNLRTLNPTLLYAAESLGASALRRMTSIVLPHCKTGLINAFLVTFVLTVTDFGVPKLLGGSFPVLATEIYNQAVGSQNFPTAVVLCLWLLGPSLASYYFSAKLKARANHVPQQAGLGWRHSPLRDLFFGLTAWLIVAVECASIGIVIYGSFVTFWPYVPTLTLQNYAFGSSTYGIAPWVHSLILAISVAILGTLTTFIGAYCVKRLDTTPKFFQQLYGALASLPLCIPGTVLGLGFALSFSSSPVFSGAVGSMALLVFNTLVHLYTVPHLTACNTLAQINPRYETVGLSMGVPVAKTIGRVIIPLSTSGLCEVFTYLFASAMTTISAVVFLYKPTSIVAAVAAIDLIDSGFISEGAAMSTLIFASALVVRLVTLQIRSCTVTL